MRVLLGAAIAVALLAPALAGGSAGVAGGSGAVTTSGQVGALQIDKSGRDAVVAFAGNPDAEIRERVLGFGSYDALGYGCSSKQAADNFGLGNYGPYCKTVFIVDSGTHTLEDFVTSDGGYHVGPAIRIGTPRSVAQRLLRGSTRQDCPQVIRAETLKAALRINFARGKADTFALHSLRRTSGLFNCMA